MKYFPNTLRLGRVLNQALERSQILRAAKAVGLHNPLMYINPYYAAHMRGRMGECGIVYDVGEDWTAFSASRALLRRIVGDDEDLTRNADAVVVVSPLLAGMKQGIAKQLKLIPNGVDVKRYREIGEGRVKPHPMAAQWPRPIIGHTGTLQQERTDIDLVVNTARRFPHATFAFVGPVDLDKVSDQKLRAEPNIKLAGAVDYAEVPRVMAAFDVCIVPHRVTAFSSSQSPLKLFEYLASGLPIVATPVAGFRDYPEVVHLGEGVDGFSQAISAALQEPKSRRAQRMKAAEPHSWDARIDAIVEVLHGLPRRDFSSAAPLESQSHGLEARAPRATNL